MSFGMRPLTSAVVIQSVLAATELEKGKKGPLALASEQRAA
jgi:hypothetical protein